jgi:hypothetical protein
MKNLKIGDIVKSINPHDEDFGTMVIEDVYGDTNCKMVGLETLFLSEELIKMKPFKITYVMDIIVDAFDEQEAQDIFDNEVDVYDLSMEFRAEFVEQKNIEEL